MHGNTYRYVDDIGNHKLIIAYCGFLTEHNQLQLKDIVKRGHSPKRGQNIVSKYDCGECFDAPSCQSDHHDVD